MTRKISRKRLTRGAVVTLEQIPNIGPSLAADLRRVGVKLPRELAGKDPYQLYTALCDATGARQDPCVLDVFISAVRFMEGAAPRPWWRYTAERKRRFPDI
jgi:hypothetical protein